MKSKTLEGASSHKNRRDGVFSAACSGLLRHHADVRARKDSWRCSFHSVLMKENLYSKGHCMQRGDVQRGKTSYAWILLACRAMHQIYHGMHKRRPVGPGSVVVRGRVAGRRKSRNQQGKKLPGSGTRQCTCNRTVRTQSHSHTPRQGPSTRRNHRQRRESGANCILPLGNTCTGGVTTEPL